MRAIVKLKKPKHFRLGTGRIERKKLTDKVREMESTPLTPCIIEMIAPRKVEKPVKKLDSPHRFLLD